MLAEVNNGVSTLEKSKRLKRIAAPRRTKDDVTASPLGVRHAVLLIWILFSLGPVTAVAEPRPPLTLNPEVPLIYRVQSGDTLWDIAALYLRDPWRWQSLWAENPEIENPHLIFPGDELRLYWEDGVPRLARQDQSDIKLTPELRASPRESAIPVIPREAIAPFLRDHSVVDAAVLASAAYVVSGDAGRLLSGVGDRLFVSGDVSQALDYRLVRSDKALEDPVTGEHLGTFVLDVGAVSASDVRGERSDGELTAMWVKQMRQEIRIGDRLLPVGASQLALRYLPQTPQVSLENGLVIAVAGGLTQIGPLDIVVINRGEREGLRVGDVLAIEQSGLAVDDPVTGDSVRLPDIRAGVLMTFAVYERASFGLVLEANRAMSVGDRVVSP